MRFRPLAAAAAAAIVLTACSAKTDTEDAAPAPTRTEAAELVQFSPLTGLTMKDGRPDHPAFVVKIENTSGGQPQISLDRADLVIEELVEGGLTRLAAFFWSELPSKVGHVRSLRATDVGITAPANGQLVASGGAGSAISRIQAADIAFFSEDAAAPGFSSDPALSRPYNRLVDLTVIARAAKGEGPTESYLTWTPDGETADPGTSKTQAATGATVRFSRSTSTTWKLDDDAWVRTNGHAEKEFRAANLIVMTCRIGDAGYTDPAGNPVPETIVEGSGKATVLRGDQAVEVTWKKAELDSPISFTTADGDPYTIDPGKTFLELVPEGDGGVTLQP